MLNSNTPVFEKSGLSYQYGSSTSWQCVYVVTQA